MAGTFSEKVGYEVSRERNTSRRINGSEQKRQRSEAHFLQQQEDTLQNSDQRRKMDVQEVDALAAEQ